MAWCRPAARSIASRSSRSPSTTPGCALEAIARAGRARTPIRASARSAARRHAAPMKLGMPRPGQRLFFGDRAFEAAYDAALERLAKLGCDDRRDRHRAVLRNRAAAVRRPVGGRAHARRALAAGLRSRRHPSGHARDHLERPAADRDGRLRRFLQTGGIAARRRTHVRARSTRWRCRPRPPPTRSRRCSPIRSSSTAGSAPTPISSICSICAGWRCRRRSR